MNARATAGQGRSVKPARPQGQVQAPHLKIAAPHPHDRAPTAPAARRAARPKAAPAVIAFPQYWDKAKRDLIKCDRVLRRVIPQYEGVSLTSRGDPFATLARSIVGQQISVAAAQAVWDRLQAAFPEFTPARLARARVDKLRSCGLSQRKAEYILDLAAHFRQGGDLSADWQQLEDDAVIAALTGIRGIGRWTAEMFLMFNLMRPDIFPVDDLGLRKAVSLHYFSGDKVTLSELREVGDNWAPWRSVGTWYMWRSLDPLPVEY